MRFSPRDEFTCFVRLGVIALLVVVAQVAPARGQAPGASANVASSEPLAAVPSSIVDGCLLAVVEMLSPRVASRFPLDRGEAAPSSARTLPTEATFVDLDALARGDTATELTRAARSFQMSQERMVARAGKAGRPQIGELPWAIIAAAEALRDALTGGRAPKAVAAARRLVDLCVRGSLPASVTRIRNTASRGSLPLGLAGWQQLELSAAAERLGFEVRVHPSRRSLVEDPSPVVFAHLLGSHEVAMDVALDSSRAAPPGGEEAIALFGARLEQAVILAAGLIEWAHADAAVAADDIVDGAAISDAAGSGAEGADPAQGASDDGARVASRSSKVFHRSSCPHAARISPANQRSFPSRSDAVNKGLRPCKTCAP